MAEYQQVNQKRGGRTLIGVVADGPPTKRSGNIWRKGWRSRALAVHPDQAKRFTEAARAIGNTDVHYDPKNGQLVSTSRAGRKWEMMRRGFHDNDAGYGDAAPL